MFEYQFELSGREYTLPMSHAEARDFLKPCIECGDMDTISCRQHGFVHGLIRLLFHGVRVFQNGSSSNGAGVSTSAQSIASGFWSSAVVDCIIVAHRWVSVGRVLSVLSVI